LVVARDGVVGFSTPDGEQLKTAAQPPAMRKTFPVFDIIQSNDLTKSYCQTSMSEIPKETGSQQARFAPKVMFAVSPVCGTTASTYIQLSG